jgi:hypothetical protein
MDLQSFEQVLDRKLAATAAEMRQHVDSTAAETRRHFDVVAEEMRAEVRLLAERVDGLSSGTVRQLEDRVGKLEAAA